MKFKVDKCIILLILFYINPLVVTQYDTKFEVTNEMLNLYKNSVMVQTTINSDKNSFKKIKQNHCEKCSVMKRSIDRILPRRKRFLIYPSASNVVVSASLVKTLAFSTPTGHNHLGEIDFFYPLPDKIYYPHRHTTTTTTTTEAPPPTMLPEIFDYHHDHHDHDHFSTGWDEGNSNVVFTPDGGWRDDIFKNINGDDSSIDANMLDVVAANSSRRYWNDELSYRNSYNNFKPPSLQSKSRRRSHFNNEINPPNAPLYYRRRRSKEKVIHKTENKLEDRCDSTHYKSYRDRRDLYSQIESIFEYKGIQVRTCILRAICEAKHFLLPKGKSLFHDIFRILFTIPTTNEMKDDYSNAVRNHDDSENCWKLYENECPISVLELLLKSQKTL